MNLNDLTLSKGQNYIFVNSNGTPQENGTALLTAYSKALSILPNGKSRTRENRFAVVLAPGKYSLDFARLNMTGEYLDLIGIGGSNNTLITTIAGDDYFYGPNTYGNNPNNGAVTSSANGGLGMWFGGGGWHPGDFCFPDGVWLGERNAALFDSDADYNLIQIIATDVKCKGFTIGCIKHTGLGANLIFEDVADLWTCSFTSTGYLGSAATFINCKFTGNNCAGGSMGTYFNCTNNKRRVGNSVTGFYHTYASGLFPSASGKFYNCILQDATPDWATDTFQNNFSNPTGLFIGCVSGKGSFGGVATTYTGTRTFANNVATDTRSKVANANISVAQGNFISCVGGAQSFGGGTGDTTANFLSCIGGDGSFGAMGTRSGVQAANIRNGALLV